jgi:hypothetical protein
VKHLIRGVQWAVLGLVFSTPGSAWASFISVNGPPSLLGGGLNTFSVVAAESFTLSASTTIRAAEFFTEEFPPLWDGTLDYFIFANNSPFPASSPLAGGQGHNPPVHKSLVVDGGVSSTTIAKYDFDLITPLTLAPGTYWLGLHLQQDFSLNGSIFWDFTTTPDAQLSVAAPGGDFDHWALQQAQIALGISDTPLVVPEPSSIGLALLGLAALARSRTHRANPYWSYTGLTPKAPCIPVLRANRRKADAALWGFRIPTDLFGKVLRFASRNQV